MRAAPGVAAGAWLRQVALLRQSIEYEFRKASVFRTGFLVREVLRDVVRPVVMIFVYYSIYSQTDQDTIRGWSYADMVGYMILVATFQKLTYHTGILRTSEEIFEGYITKYMVMPVRYFVLTLASFVQHLALQLGVAALVWTAGWVLLPTHWPVPASSTALLQSLVLVCLGSYCYFTLYFILNCLAFWLEVVWTLLVMASFVADFASGAFMPISWMPEPLAGALRWLFPYWSLSGPIEIFMGRLGSSDFMHGLIVLLLTALVFDRLRVIVWKRGTRRYVGGGM